MAELMKKNPEKIRNLIWYIDNGKRIKKKLYISKQSNLLLYLEKNLLFYIIRYSGTRFYHYKFKITTPHSVAHSKTAQNEQWSRLKKTGKRALRIDGKGRKLTLRISTTETVLLTACPIAFKTISDNRLSWIDSHS